MAEAATERVNVIAPGGQAGTMSAEEFAQRTKAGEHFQLESDEARKLRKFKEQSGIGTALRAGAEEAADTLTFGGYSAAGRALGGEKFAEESRMARETSPVARTIGLAGGLILPALLTGGASAAAEGAAGVAEGAEAARAGLSAAEAANAASGATAASRGLLGLGARAVTAPVRGAMALGHGAEHLVGKGLGALGLTGETALGKSVLGAAKMAAGGATEGALFGAGSALSEASLAPDGDYNHLAEKLLAGAKEGALFGAALGGAVGGVSGMGEKFASKMADAIGDVKFGELAEKNAAKAIAFERGAAEEATAAGYGTRLLKDDVIKGARSYDDMLARSRAVKQAGNELLDTTHGLLDDAGRVVDTKPIWSRVEREVLEPLAKRDEAAAATLRRELQPVAGDAVGFQDLHRLTTNLEPAQIWGTGVPSKAFKEGIEKAQSILGKGLDESVRSGLGTLSNDELRAIGLRRGITLEGTAADAAAHADTFAASNADGGALKAYEDARHSVDASSWAENQLLKRAEAGTDGGGPLHLTDSMKGAATAIGLMTRGLTGGVLGTATSAASSYLRKHGRSILADLAYRAQEADNAIAGKIRSFVRNTGKGSYTAAEQITHHKIAAAEAFAVEDHALGRHGKESREEAFQRTAQAVRNGAGSEPMIVHAEAPQTGDAMRAVIQRGMAFLQTKLPPGQGTPNPLYAPPPPSAGSVAEFAKYVRAVKDPLSVLDSMNNGTISKQEIEALQAVYPTLYDKIRTGITEQLTNRVKTDAAIPHAKTLNLGVMFGIPTDPALEPGNYQVIQASYSETTTQNGQKTTTTTTIRAPAQAAASMGKLSEALATGAERLEGQELEI